MGQIFISHSARDEEYRNFFNKAFATSSVNAKYEEIEELYQGTITTQNIEQDITLSSAVFVLLSRNIDSLPHTRDWIGYEVGFAKGGQGGNKDVWVFEHINDVGQLTKVIPNFDHYVVYDTSDTALVYMKRIVESYDDRRVLKNMALGAGGGAALVKENPLVGLIGGALGGAIYSTVTTDRPQGIEVTCECVLKYRIHIPEHLSTYRCTKCNNWYYKPGVALPLQA
jgi:hypothetical protein